MRISKKSNENTKQKNKTALTIIGATTEEIRALRWKHE